MVDSYVTSDATLKCTQGDQTAKLAVLPSRISFLAGKPMANISDTEPILNIGSFGMCQSLVNPTVASATSANFGTLTPMPCLPNTPMPWSGGKADYPVRGKPALLKSCTCTCMWGGTISIIDDGQRFGGRDSDSYILRKRQLQMTQMIEEMPDNLTQQEKIRMVLMIKEMPDNLTRQEKIKIAENNLEIEKALGIKKGRNMTIEKADKQSANPNYYRDTSYKINCATASATFALRVRGFDITAKGKSQENPFNNWLSYGDNPGNNSFKIWKNVDGTNAETEAVYTQDWMQQHSVTEMNSDLYKQYLEDACAEEGVYIVAVRWKSTYGGHITIVQSSKDADGNLQLFNIEPQLYNKHLGVQRDINTLTNRLTPNPSSGCGVLRVDNKIFDTNYLSLFDT